MRLNLNADLGESWGAYAMGNDRAMLEIVASANIACGLHGGEPRVMQETLRLARGQSVSVGAHPGYADLYGFGRRPQSLSEDDLAALVAYQIGALAAIAGSEGWPITHVKPHGALNNQAFADLGMARIIARTIQRFDPALILLAPVFSQLARAGQEAGLRVALEVFADRTYEADGQLTPRGVPGAVLHDPAAARDHVLAMVDRAGVTVRDGNILETPFHSICVHGDGDAAVSIARAVRQALEAAGHSILPIPALVA
ncbi:LamB/YcsF family protein [Rhodobacter sp. Har01]|uniref:LamB/YcsF family protein n=1 Tax=Rhodobacter sp. Har01 TaxID=2883999 RepID=UPI001D092C2C|nr:5-oxoprolinase subunit PxpA [Rhodobacter sp. Har01]MCB6179425.1 LamB/YcsF family protein [Rhodobacter sp. Har01]